MPPIFDPEKCTICGMCVEVCPGDLLVLDDTGPKVLYPGECWHCGNCQLHCQATENAVEYRFPLSMLI